MTALASVLAALLPAVWAWPVLQRLDVRPSRGLGAAALRLGLALLLGTGAASVLAYAWLAAGGALGRGYLLVEAGLGAGGAALAWRGRARHEGPTSSPDWIHRAAIAAAIAGLLVFAAAFVRESMASPHGAWDAWAIWNLRARFMLRGGPAWTFGFSPELTFSQLGYPLLLPGAVARVWAWAGESPAGPIAVAGVFALAPVLVIAGAVERRAGALAGAAAALLLLATPEWLTWALAQYADAPIAAYAAAAAAALLGARGEGGKLEAGPLVLAGALLGFGAWTKDEGLALAALLGAWAAVQAGRSAVRAGVLLGAGAALPLLARIHFQVSLAPGFAAVFTSGQTPGSALARILDPARWATILSLAPRAFPGVALALPAVAVAAALLLGARPREVLRSPVVLPAIAAYGVYLLVWSETPVPLEWHVVNSAPRVLLQPWPALLLGLFALARRAPAALPVAQPESGPP